MRITAIESIQVRYPVEVLGIWTIDYKVRALTSWVPEIAKLDRENSNTHYDEELTFYSIRLAMTTGWVSSSWLYTASHNEGDEAIANAVHTSTSRISEQGQIHLAPIPCSLEAPI